MKNYEPPHSLIMDAFYFYDHKIKWIRLKKYRRIHIL